MQVKLIEKESYEYQVIKQLMDTRKKVLSYRKSPAWFDGYVSDERYKYHGYFPEQGLMREIAVSKNQVYIDISKTGDIEDFKLLEAITLEKRAGLDRSRLYAYIANETAKGITIKITDFDVKAVKGKLLPSEYRELSEVAEEWAKENRTGYLYATED